MNPTSNLRETIRAMANSQDRVNEIMQPGWMKSGIAYYRGAWREAVELLDGVGWEWWRKQTPAASQQLRLELVDILHFMISSMLCMPARAGEPSGLDRLESNIEAAVYGSATWAREHQVVYWDRPLELIEGYIAEVLKDKARGLRSWRLFVLMCDRFGLDFEPMARTYIGKNTLNFFRQENGYKTGEYIKHFPLAAGDGPVEDNVHLEHIMASLSREDISRLPTLVHEQLTERYQTLAVPLKSAQTD